MPHRSVPAFQRGNAKRLRREMTDAERKLWRALRAGRLGNIRFRRQVPLGRYIVDFLCPEQDLIIEVDGGQHGTNAARACDSDRTAWLAAKGYRLLRFWNQEVLFEFDSVLARVRHAVGLDVEWEFPPFEKEATYSRASAVSGAFLVEGTERERGR